MPRHEKKGNNNRNSLIETLIVLNYDYNRGILQCIQKEQINLTDLKARYHRDCYKRLMKEKQNTVVDAANNYSSKKDEAMEEIFEFISLSDECHDDTTHRSDTNIKVIPHEYTTKNRLKKNCPIKLFSLVGTVVSLTYVFRIIYTDA